MQQQQQQQNDDKDPVLFLLPMIPFWILRVLYREPLTMSTQVLNEVFSDPFTVYTPKTFPGMTGLEERGQRGEGSRGYREKSARERKKQKRRVCERGP